MSTATIPLRTAHRRTRQAQRPATARTEKKTSENHSGWRPYLIPTVRGFALILLAFGFWALAAWLGNRIPMVLTLACVILLIGACAVTLCGWIVPVNDHGQFSHTGFFRFLSPRVVSTQVRWSRLDADGETVAEESGPSLPQKRGWYRLRAWRCEWRDPFGLFEARRIIKQKSDLFNPTVPLPPESRHSTLHRGTRPGRISSRDSESPASVRDYTRGDPLRLISWHQSAHRGRLIVREGDEVLPSPILVLDCSQSADVDRVAGTAAYLLHHAGTLQSSSATSSPLLTDGFHLTSDDRSNERLLATALPLQSRSSSLFSSLRGILSRAVQSGRNIIVVTSNPDSTLCQAALSGTTPFLQAADIVVAGHFSAASADTHTQDVDDHSTKTAQSIASSTPADKFSTLRKPTEALFARIVRTLIAPLLAFAGLLTLTALPLHDLYGSGPWIAQMCVLMGLAILLSEVPRIISLFRTSVPTRHQRRLIFLITALAGVVVLLLVCLVCCLMLRSDLLTIKMSTSRRARRAPTSERAPSLWVIAAAGTQSFFTLVPPVQTLPHEQMFLVALSTGISILIFLLLLFLPSSGFALTLLPAIALAVLEQMTGTQTPIWQLALLVLCAIVLLWWPGALNLRPLLPGFLAIVTCLTSAFVAPAATIQAARDGLFGYSASSSFSDSAINPMVNLTRSLQLNSPTVAFTYQSPEPLRFRLATLSDFSSGTWSFDQTLSSGMGLYSGSRRRNTNDSIMAYTTSARQPYPRQSVLQRAIDGTKLLDRADARRRTESNIWADTQPNASAREQTSELLQRTQAGLTRSTRVRIASLQSRFLPVLGLPSRVDGIDSSWQWTGDQVAFSTQSSALSSRVSYRVTGQYIPAIGTPSGLDGLEASLRLASDYRSRCIRAVNGVSAGYRRVGQEWRRYYSSNNQTSQNQNSSPRPERFQLTREQNQALQQCIIDFADQDAFSTQYLYPGMGYGNLNTSANWMVDDDADSIYQTTAISYRGAINSTNWKTVNGRAYRQIPANVPERVSDVVQTARERKVPTDGRGARHEMAALRWLLRYFTKSGFTYSLNVPGSSAQGNLQAISDFLRTKRGYCVHYATAFALLARMMGVATRVDLGYSSGSSPVADGNNTDSLPEYATTQSQLHSWVEAYVDGIGWVPFDVTPGYTGAAAHRRPSSVSEKDVQKARSQGNRQSANSSSSSNSSNEDRERLNLSDTRNNSSRSTDSQRTAQRSQSQNHSSAAAPRHSARPQTRAHSTHHSFSGGIVALRIILCILALLILLIALALAFPLPRRLVRKYYRFRLLHVLEQSTSHRHQKERRQLWTLAWQEFLDAGEYTGLLPHGSRRRPTTLTISDMIDRAVSAVPASRDFLHTLGGHAQAIAYGMAEKTDDSHPTDDSRQDRTEPSDTPTDAVGTPVTDALLAFEKGLKDSKNDNKNG
jgi:transglutaminase-like putative cysteine protease/uncharacterized protein (DUF58 family)